MCSLHWQHTTDSAGICARNFHHASQLPFSFCGFTRKDVLPEGFTSNNLSRRGLLEALRSASVRLKLWHESVSRFRVLCFVMSQVYGVEFIRPTTMTLS